MAFDYNSRTKWEKERVDRWNKEHEKQVKKLSPAQQELFGEVRDFSSYPHCGFPVINKWSREKVKKDAGGRSLKEILYAECAGLIDILVPKQYKDDFDYMLDQFANYQYSRSLFRPTVRTSDPAAHVLDAFGLMQAYKILGIYGVTPLEYLTERSESAGSAAAGGSAVAAGSAAAGGSVEAVGSAVAAGSAAATGINDEFLDFKHSDSFARDLHMVQFDDVLAARIDRGDAAVIEAAKEAILSDNNTVIVTVPLIRGIVKSRNTELHELLAKFLVAARLQEGVRQAVCENADCGRAEAFLTILKAIEDNDLLRFSAVKRAIATWTGICNLDSMDRVSAKLLAYIGEAVRDRGRALEMTKTDDSVQIVTGLWAIGFYEARDAISRMLEIVESGTKNQRLTISYYNHYMQFSEYSGKAAGKILETYPDDPQMAAAFMPTYLDAVDTIIRNCIRDEKNQPVYSVKDESTLHYDLLDAGEFWDSEEQARLHYGILKGLADSMKKRKIEYYLRVLLHAPKTEIQRSALIGYVADKESFTRQAAFQILKKMQNTSGGGLTDDEYRQLEGYLRLKNEETRRNVIELLEGQERPKVDESIRRLLGAGQDQAGPASGKAEQDAGDAGKAGQDAGKGRKSAKALSAADKEQMRLAGLDMLKRRSDSGGDAKRESAALLREVLPDDTGLTDKEKVLYGEIAGSEGAGSILNTEGYGLYDPKASYEPVLDARGGVSKGSAAQESAAQGSAAKEGAVKKGAKLLSGIFGSGKDQNAKILSDFFSLRAKEMDQYFDRIRAFVIEHGKLEYTSVNGDRQLLENGLYLINYDYSGAIETRYPFPELWIEVYETIIKDPKVFFNLYFAIRDGFTEKDVKDVEAYRKAEKTIFGEAYSGYDYRDPKYKSSYGGHSIYQTILDIISSQQHLVLPAEIARAAVLEATRLPEEIRWMEKAPSKYQTYYTQQRPTICFVRTNKFRSMLSRACHYENDEEFRAVFPLLHEVDRVYQFNAHEPKTSYGSSSRNILSMFSYVKAHELGLITRDYLFKAAFEILGLPYAVGELGELFRPNVTIYTLRNIKEYMAVDLEKRTMDTECRFYQLCEEVYRKLVDLILDVELKRGDTPTVFSDAVSRISRIEGIPRLMEILRALGNDTLDRNTYYSFNSGTSKKECMSHLLKVCWPAAARPQARAAVAAGTATARSQARAVIAAAGETATDLKKAVKENKVSADRLIEVAMYAPQWLDLAEEVLGIDGFKSGCYYFMAHMNERFDDRKKAVIARYTPLSPEELNNGCFDTNWFFEVYEKLGEKNFAKLYKAAKYIADGSKHTRARKYADAATGKVDRDELEKTIADKRNKDLLMSYGLIPLKDVQDELHRYEFLQKFLKESRQFGAQRRASEAQCVQYAMKNMATTAGYADELRLTLAMETELVSSNQQYFDGMEIGEYTARILVDADGKSELALYKGAGGKALKSVPAALKKDEAFLEVKEFAAKLKDQYSRCAAMFERAMEEEDAYSYEELCGLCRNPVTAGILGRLVFVGEGDAQAAQAAGSAQVAKDGSAQAAGAGTDGRATGVVGTLEELKAAEPALSPETRLLVAHPITLNRLGALAGYQRLFFEKQRADGTRQPFKQVFREFYPKLEEEKDASDSRLFAGYQIQPKRKRSRR